MESSSIWRNACWAYYEALIRIYVLMAFRSKPQDEQAEKIEEKIEKSETEKAIDLVSKSEIEIKKHAKDEVASRMVEIEKGNDNSLSSRMEQTPEPLSKQIDFMQTYQGEAIENYRQLAESYIDFQKKMLDAWTPYFRAVSYFLEKNR